MYAFFKGTLAATAENYAVVECGGIGYRIFGAAALSGYSNSGWTGKTVYPSDCAEDELSLYGFESESGKQMFERLIGFGYWPQSRAGDPSQMSRMKWRGQYSLEISVLFQK